MKRIEGKSNFIILIADDLEVNRKLISSYLKSSENIYKIVEAINGKDAYELCVEHKPDIVLMDWEMPEMTGIQSLEKIKNNPELKDIPVIMQTALSASTNLAKAFQKGATDFIRKPVDKIELLARINSSLELSISYNKIKNQNKSIEEKNIQLNNSIKYASYIQEAMRLSEKKLIRLFSEYFIFFKPKDVLSGDFYWFSKLKIKNKEYSVIATVDCTGHGIPGAFLSIIGSIYLDQIINQEKIIQSNKILEVLHQYVRKSLQQDKNENVDGMDAALCVINHNEQYIDFCGAVNPLIYILDNNLFEVEGNFEEIGGIFGDANRKFKNHIIDLKNKKANFYIFTDGYQDQTGGYQEQRFSKVRLHKLLQNISGKSFDQQLQMVETNFVKWKGSQNQSDDILIIGFELDFTSK